MGIIIAWMHSTCKFAKRYGAPLRIYEKPKVYEKHWRRELPCSRGDFYDLCLESDAYKEHLSVGRPHFSRAVFGKRLCRCLVDPTFDQCSDPINTLLELNLEIWHTARTKWHADASRSCHTPSCECSDEQSAFRQASQSVQKLEEWWLCARQAAPDLEIPEPDEHAGTPEFHCRNCVGNRCDNCPMDLLLECDIECNDDHELDCYEYIDALRGYDEDGQPKMQRELAVVSKTYSGFMEALTGATDAYFLHQYEDEFTDHRDRRQRARHRQTPGDKTRIRIDSDFSSRTPLEQKKSSTCQSAPLATCCVAVVIYYPEELTIEVTTNTGESAIETIQRGGDTSWRKDSRVDNTDSIFEKTTTKKNCFKTDYWRSYSTGRGDSTWHHTFMRDIVSFYKTGRLKYATYGWLDGVGIESDGQPLDRHGVAIPAGLGAPLPVQFVPELPDLTTVQLETDGCGSQYVCCKCALGTAMFHSDTGCRLWHNVRPAGTFCGVHDNAGHDATHAYRNHVKVLHA